MSIQSVDLKCELCGFQSSTRETWGDFYYLHNELKIPINRTLGWCRQCDKICAIEDFSQQKNICEEIESLLSYFNNDYSQKKVLFISKKVREDRLFKLNLIQILNEQLKLISTRIGTEKCLNCGSSKIDSSIGEILSTMQDRIQHNTGVIGTGVIHPNCGGEIIASPSPIHITMEFTPRFYKRDGSQKS